jgi:hypothetical protein
MAYTKFNATFRTSVLEVTKKLGLQFISTKRQVNNGTLMFLDPETGVKYAMHDSGYIRRHIKGFRHSFMKEDPVYHYPLNKRASYIAPSTNGWNYRQNGTYMLAGPDEQLGILVRAVINYRKK